MSVLWLDISHTIAEPNRASHCIADNNQYIEVSI